MIVGILVTSSPLWSDVRMGSGASASQRVCYCDCDAKPGSPMCLRMCELAKYENRSWATSCHKQQDSDDSEPTGAPGASSTKNNRVQQARR
jgi:hypothetical protein